MEEQNNELELSNNNEEIINEAEWCFQFDDEPAKIIAVTPQGKVGEPLSVTINLTNTLNSNVTFASDDGRRFTLFARPITDEGRELRAMQQNLDQPTEEGDEVKS